MQDDDTEYLLKKQYYNLQEELEHYIKRQTLYEDMFEMMNKYNIRNAQERFLSVDLQKLINFFENKIDITKLKLRDIQHALEK